MTIGSCGPTGPRLFSGSWARARLAAAGPTRVRTAAAVKSFSWVRGVIIGLLLKFDARAKESRAHCKLFYCGAVTELCCSARQKAAWPAAAGFLPKERFDFRMMAA